MKSSTYHVFFSNLANPLRIQIIESLKKSEKNVSELSKELNVEQSKISHSLTSLRCCNIVEVKQSGKKRVYSLNTKTIVPILKLIDTHAKLHCKGGCVGCKK
jgi:DNA-binding transcriptional ArsR family regulator